ncbi:hypothetical protein VHEMI10287 [[Torrubiella] hemipterigena]|uniref:Uncharacterized protein n=1 Tax=[Torrubiella] hemipterigena TaxID=1531966 RepID=A0A0A1TRM4_9HYPO|nr:hypothetical protein VHEMI10287 [[Torrubiella] hemipterigena]
MPTRPLVERHELSVPSDRLPFPAEKLVITKIAERLDNHPQSWACLIIGAFYDIRGRIIWSRETFVLCDPSQVELPEADGDWFLTELYNPDELTQEEPGFFYSPPDEGTLTTSAASPRFSIDYNFNPTLSAGTNLCPPPFFSDTHETHHWPV